MATLLCLGLGYCAEHYVAQHGARFARIVGTTRAAERADAISAGGRIEMMMFDSVSPAPNVMAAAHDADAVLISAAPDEHGDPILRALGNTLPAAPRLAPVILLWPVGVYGAGGGAGVDETVSLEPVHERSRPRVAAEQAWQALGRQRGITV